MSTQTRFQYHFEPKKGWMNDPNGLVWFKGYYHAFFQHNPYATHWDRMHWGHAVSTDLIHWQELEIALYPDQPYEDAGGCYSGSAIVKEDTLYLFYTSVSQALGQTQSVAMSTDGVHFTKYEGNPVIDHWPEQGSKEFRDPMVFENPRGGYSMIVGTDHADLSALVSHGRVVMYNSPDLLHWTFSHVLYEAQDYAVTIECPNFFPLGDRYVLMYSCMDYPTYATRFVVGDFDGHTFIPDHTCTPEVGPQFYAPQTFRAPDGRRILIGWFFDWKRKVPKDAEWTGALTIPRELTLSPDGSLCNYPVHEATGLLRTVSQTSVAADEGAFANESAVTNDSAMCTCEGPIFTSTGLTIPRTSAGDLVCPIKATEIQQVDILEDGNGRGFEVFVNHGQWSASVLR